MFRYKLDSTDHGYFSESSSWKYFSQTCGLYYVAHKNPAAVSHILTIVQKIPCDSNILSRNKNVVSENKMQYLLYLQIKCQAVILAL